MCQPKDAGLCKKLNKTIDETQVDLQAVKMSIDTWTGSLKDDITNTKKDFHEAIASMRNDLHEELSLMIHIEAQTMEALTDHEGGTGTGAGVAKPSKFDGTTSWAMFQYACLHKNHDQI
jgi:hypothetical protein